MPLSLAWVVVDISYSVFLGRGKLNRYVHSTPRWSCEYKDVRTRVGHGWMLNRVLILAAHLKRRFYR